LRIRRNFTLNKSRGFGLNFGRIAGASYRKEICSGTDPSSNQE
jgi:hypothetical protein